MSTDKRGTLKRCPFCGSLGTYVWDDIKNVWISGCTNGKCLASYKVLSLGYNGFAKDIEKARRIWNRRAE